MPATPQEMAAYYEGFPDPDDPSTWGTRPDGQPAQSFAQAKAGFEAVHGPAPTPTPVPGPPSPGAGMPAARITDMCAHGGVIIGPGEPTVLIGFLPAVRAMPAMDTAVCPMFDALVPHATGTILKGSNTVLIGNFPAARVSDPIGPPANCKGNQIAMGCTTVLIGESGGGGGGGGSGGGAVPVPGGGPGSTAPTDPGAESGPSTYADSQPEDQPPGQSTQQVDTGTHWLEIELVDEAEQPVVGERYLCRLPDGKEVGGGLDGKGQARLTGIKTPGVCQIKFPNLDMAAWERWRPGPSAPPAGGGSSSPAGANSDAETTPVPPGTAARGGAYRTVRQGECVSSIAKDTGHFWQVLWDHGSNAELKRRRGNPNVLLPGDAVFIPDKRPKEEPGNTDTHHKFRRKGEPAALRLRVEDDGEPICNAPYRLEVDGAVFEGVTDADGRLECVIPGNAHRAKLLVGESDEQVEYALLLGTVDPIDTRAGVVQRLQNLGYAVDDDAGEQDEDLAEALRTFQGRNGLPETGEPDAATRTKLLEVHGS